MANDAFRVKFWGVRGSVPVSGPEFFRYGGNTSCVEMRCGEHLLLFDAGSGARAAGEIYRESGTVKDIDLLFTHCHYDHIIGFPFFAPLYDPKIKLTLWSGHLAGVMTTKEMTSAFMGPPWFPAPIEICKARFAWKDFKADDVLRPRPGIVIRTAYLNHPGKCIGYRVEWGGRAVAYVTDTEHIDGQLDKNVLGLIDRADLVIYDATYLEDEMPRRRGFGHSTWQQGVKLCEAAHAKRLALFHHDPVRTDTDLETIENAADAAFPGTFAARDGQEIVLKAKTKVKAPA